MERTLRSAFCSLVGSKHAAIVAAEMSAAQLIDLCKALVKAHREIPEPKRAAIINALTLCSNANVKRNTLVHGVKTGVTEHDGSFKTISVRRRDYKLAVKVWTPETLNAACQELGRADIELFGTVQAAVSPEILVMDETLAWEDHFDVNGNGNGNGNGN
jgi:hypothetical protein